MRRLTLKNFVKMYVDRNNIIHLYERHPYVTKIKGAKVDFWGEQDEYYEKKDTIYKELWHGMEWQCVDTKYCKERGLEICPYNDKEVLKVIYFNHKDAADEIDLLIEENNEVEYANEED